MILFAAILSLAAAVAASLLTGSANAFDPQIFWVLRLPRTIAGVAVGGGLSVAGVLVQAALGNALADPFTLGTASAAALGAVAGAYLGFSGIIGTGISAFIFALAAMFSLLVWLRASFRSVNDVLLAGVVSGLFFTSLTTFILVLTDPANWINSMSWMLGSFSLLNFSESSEALTVVFILVVLSWFQWKPLDLLATDETLAASSGVDVAKLRRRTFTIVCLLVAVTVSLAGVVGFVGFVIPHSLRMLGVRTHRMLIPSAFFAGSAAVVLADVLARSAAQPTELPVGVILAILGAPAFLGLLKRQGASG